MTDKNPTQAWVIIERDHSPTDLAVAYRNVAEAEHAMEHALLIDSLVEEDCAECYVSAGPLPPEIEQVHTDPHDPHDTGRGASAYLGSERELEHATHLAGPARVGTAPIHVMTYPYVYRVAVTTTKDLDDPAVRTLTVDSVVVLERFTL